MKAVIHINQHNIRHNINCPVEERKDVITCKTYKNNTYSNSLLIVDDAGNVIARWYTLQISHCLMGRECGLKQMRRILNIEERMNETNT